MSHDGVANLVQSDRANVLGGPFVRRQHLLEQIERFERTLGGASDRPRLLRPAFHHCRRRATARPGELDEFGIGEVGITAIPDEVYAITGLKLKLQSPLVPTFNIELANGAEGYIPPPEQHELGGYTTWPARTAGLEVEAEPQIVETLLKLLEQVADKPRRKIEEPPSPYSKAVLASKPIAYWRLSEIELVDRN